MPSPVGKQDTMRCLPQRIEKCHCFKVLCTKIEQNRLVRDPVLVLSGNSASAAGVLLAHLTKTAFDFN